MYHYVYIYIYIYIYTVNGFQFLFFGSQEVNCKHKRIRKSSGKVFSLLGSQEMINVNGSQKVFCISYGSWEVPFGSYLISLSYIYIVVEHVYLKFIFSKMCDVWYVHTTDKSRSISNNDQAKRIVSHPECQPSATNT